MKKKSQEVVGQCSLTTDEVALAGSWAQWVMHTKLNT
jgi:hypothetical protein